MLSAFLAAHGMHPVSLAVFRGAGALAGTLGASLFPAVCQIVGLRLGCLAHVAFQSVAVLVAAFVFPSDGTGGLGAHILVFMGAVTASRIGLYGFDVGVRKNLTF